ncbi:MAG: hypothetical protein LBM69_09505, partial [Lachnospiraceae bacterium]|nr:hypothetical protein [Lachnospiraceae bacterium]
MYLIALIVGILMILLLLLSGREDALKGSLKLPKAFMRMAGYVYRQTHKLPKHLPESKMVRRCLTQLYPGEAWADLHKAFYTEKIALCLAILAAATLLGVVLKAQSTASVTLQSGNMFYRDEYDKGDRSVTLAARVEDQYQGTWAVNVNSRSLDRDEANETVAVFWEQVCNRIFANQSKEGEVRTDIDLLRELPSYPFTIEWKSSKPDILDANGKIGRVTNSEEILLTAQIRYEQNAEPVLAAEEWMDSDTDIQEASFTWEYQLPIIVLPIEQSEEAKIRNELGKMLQETHTKTASEKEWVLPTDWDGQDIIWEEVPDDSSIVFFAIGLTVTILVFFLMNKDLQGKTQKRSGKMLDDYPLLINKLVLYLGAGMTIRG